MVGIKYGASFRLLPFKLFEESDIIANGIMREKLSETHLHFTGCEANLTIGII